MIFIAAAASVKAEPPPAAVPRWPPPHDADVAAALACAVWDPEQGRLISFAQADAQLDAAPLAAK